MRRTSAIERLQLESVELFSSAQDQTGNVQHAKFWVTVSHPDNTASREVYGLEAMTDAYYRGWYLDAMLLESDEDQEDIPEEYEEEPAAYFPLVIPAEIVATRGLTTHMQSAFFAKPDRINLLTQFLQGPVASEEHLMAS